MMTIPRAGLARVWTERRAAAADRRRRHVLLGDWHWAWRGRRTSVRRVGEVVETGSDRYPPALIGLAVALLMLSAADALLTLKLIGAGVAHEFNPLMRVLMDHDVQVFVNLKLALTAAGLLLMVPCADMRMFRRLRVRRVLQFMIVMYTALVGYEIGALLAIG